VHPTVGTTAAAAEANGGRGGDHGAAARRRWDLPSGKSMACSQQSALQEPLVYVFVPFLFYDKTRESRTETSSHHNNYSPGLCSIYAFVVGSSI